MKIISIGSCLSHLTAKKLDFKYGFKLEHNIYHNRSDAIINYFVDKNRMQIPFELLSKMLTPKQEYLKISKKFLENQYLEKTFGYYELIKSSNQNFLYDIKHNSYDAILIDNLMDVAFKLALPTENSQFTDFSSSGVYLNLHFYENEEYLKSQFKYDDFLTPQQSVNNHIKIISYLKALQPKAKIFFLPYHYSTSSNVPDRQIRMKLFYSIFKEYAFANNIYLIPPLNIKDDLILKDNDWTHYKDHVYEALASMIYLNLICDLPKIAFAETIFEASEKINRNNLKNPYEDLPSTSFWKRSVSSKNADNIDLIISTKFKIINSNLIASAGSCFAQYIANVLQIENYKYLITETLPESSEAKNDGFGVFPARFGNIYTTRQLRQLFDRAFNITDLYLQPWIREDGKYVDPFRPTIQIDGFDSEEGVIEDRTPHLLATKKMFEECDIFIFTLGLTESWISKDNNISVPIAPGVSGGTNHLTKFKFHNLTYEDCFNDLIYFVDSIKSFNSKIKIILTVSPVPLAATYENEHVLVATTHSKSILRSVAGKVSRIRDFVDYFPSYELITGNFNKSKYYSDNLREISPDGVKYVMSFFTRSYLDKHNNLDNANKHKNSNDVEHYLINNGYDKYKNEIKDIICDEELLDKLYKN